MIIHIIRYELLKVFNKRFFIAIVALLLLANMIVFLKSQYEDHGILIQHRDEYRKFENNFSQLNVGEASKQLQLLQNKLQSFQLASEAMKHADLKDSYIEAGMLTTDNINDFQQSIYYDDNNLLLRDRYFIELLTNQYHHVITYPQHIAEMNNRAENAMHVSIFQNPDRFSYRNIQKTIEDFDQYDKLKLTGMLDQGLVSISSYQFFDLSILIMMLVICYYLFQYEKERGLLLLLRSNANGRSTTIIAKLIAYLILLSTIFGLIFLSVVGIAVKLYGLSDFSTIIQSIPQLSNGNYVFSLGQYLIMFFLVKWAVYIGISLFLAMLFIVFQHMGQIVLLLIVVVVSELLCYSFIHPNSFFGIFKYINVFYAIETEQLLTRYRNINVLGYPVSAFELLICSLLLFIAVMVYISIKAYTKKNTMIKMTWLSKRWLLPKLARPYYSKKLFFHEAYKILFTGKSIIILLLAIAFCYLNIQQRPITEDTNRSNYMEYLSQYHGELTPEKIQLIELEKTRLEAIPSQLQQLHQKYEADHISREYYIEESNQLQLQYAKLEGFSKLYEEMIQASVLPITLELINQYAASYLYQHEFRIQLQGAVYIILLIIITSSVITVDYRANMMALLKSTSNGRRKLLLHKHFVVFFLAGTIYVLIFCTTYYNVIAYYPFFNWQAPIQSFSMFSHLTVPLTIWQFSAVQIMLHVLMSLIVIESVLYLSEILKKQGLVISAASILFVLPLMLTIIGWETINVMSFNALILWPLITAKHVWLVAALVYVLLVVAMNQRFAKKGADYRWN